MEALEKQKVFLIIKGEYMRNDHTLLLNKYKEARYRLTYYEKRILRSILLCLKPRYIQDTGLYYPAPGKVNMVFHNDYSVIKKELTKACGMVATLTLNVTFVNKYGKLCESNLSIFRTITVTIEDGGLVILVYLSQNLRKNRLHGVYQNSRRK